MHDCSCTEEVDEVDADFDLEEEPDEQVHDEEGAERKRKREVQGLMRPCESL